MKPIYVLAAVAVTLCVIGVGFLISSDSLLWTVKALPAGFGRDLLNAFSLLLNHKVPVMITVAVLAVIDFVRRVPVIRSR